MRLTTSVLAAVMTLAIGSSGISGQVPLSPLKESGQGVSPGFEGWFKNSDGTFTLLVGYFNRNVKEVLEVPVGPNNRIEPGGPDHGQPTRFLPRRQYGVFTIKVPADFGDKKLTWTLVANGETNTVPLSLHKNYEVAPYRDIAMENTPPVVKFTEDGAGVTGPPIGVAASLKATVGTPLPLTFWVSDRPGKETAVTGRNRGGSAPVKVSLSLFRGPASVAFSPAEPVVDFKANGRTSSEVVFSAPGDYTLRVQLNDASGEGGGGFQCCWTNAHVSVSVASGGGR